MADHSPVRILFIAPDAVGIDSNPEIRDISSRRSVQVTVLSGEVTHRDVYTASRDGYDVLHFVAHGGEEGVILSNGALMTYTEIAQTARIAGARLIFFNSCDTGKPASYVVSHGVTWAVFGNVPIPDVAAWQYPNGFYQKLTNMEPHTIAHALRVADNGSGDYGYTISLDTLLHLIEEGKESLAIPMRPWQLAVMAVVMAIATIITIYAVAWGT